ncbi:MAG: 3-oxoadipate enol-lactonase [Rhodobacteraceae bacterium]|jgi:3-oxoadipate enol-lactonase|nr:3-oxoadipate enol-lactonase [Paracoccaceae bacterium]
MQIADLGDVQLHCKVEGEGAPLVFANSLMTDFRMWDRLVSLLPGGLRIIRYDKRAHGLSSMPPGPYVMDQLVTDLERLLSHLGVSRAVVVGLSVGGLIAQGLAARRPDLLAGVVLSNTAGKISTQEVWDGRFAAVRAGGTEAIADATMQRWFPQPFRDSPEGRAWRTMFVRQMPEAFLYVGNAIAGADFRASTARLTLPVLGIGGSEDGSTPTAGLVETLAGVASARVHEIKGAGHLACVDGAAEYARALTGFLREIKYI